MTSPKRSLHPTSSNNRGSLLRALEFVARGGVQLAQIVGAVVGQRMPLEPRPQIFDGIQVGGIRRKKGDLDVPAQRVEVVAHPMAAMRLQAIPDYQQGLLEMRFQRFEKFDNIFFLDAALVQPEPTVGACNPCNNRDMIPVEVKLNDRRLSLGRPGTYARGAFADSRLVYKNDQSAFALGFFLRTS